MTDQNPKEISAEEQAVIDDGKRQLEHAKMAIGQPLPAMHDPMWLLSDEGAEVLKHALGRNAKGEWIQPKTGTVTVTVPKEFVYHATNFHRFVIRPGVRDVPASFMDIPYIISKGVRVWDRPKPQVQTILGSTTLGPTVKYLGHDAPSGNFVTAAFETSKMSVEQWNALGDEERGTRTLDEITRAEAAQATSKDVSEGRARDPRDPRLPPLPPPNPAQGQGLLPLKPLNPAQGQGQGLPVLKPNPAQGSPKAPESLVTGQTIGSVKPDVASKPEQKK